MTKREELKNKMSCGDWIVVSNMLKISPKNARMSFLRQGSMHFTAIVDAIEKVVENRKALFNKDITDNKIGGIRVNS
jgi:hypothetical protein